jgi:hypothetical protein
MKINEAIQPSDKTLLESFSQNTEGFLAEDLVKVYRTEASGKWTPASYDEAIDELDSLMELDKNGD